MVNEEQEKTHCVDGNFLQKMPAGTLRCLEQLADCTWLFFSSCCFDKPEFCFNFGYVWLISLPLTWELLVFPFLHYLFLGGLWWYHQAPRIPLFSSLHYAL